MVAERVVIIGAGPAGLASAMQLKRHGIAPVVFEREMIGGLLRNANLVENYPGFPDGVSGVRLVRLFEKQAENAGVAVTFDEVKCLEYGGGLFHVETGSGVHRAEFVVVASGTRPRQLTDIRAAEGVGDKIFYEVYPLLKVARRRIAIVGAGDAAFDYALNLARNNRVIILNRGETLKCLPLLWERAQANANVRYLQNTVVSSVAPGAEESIQLECLGPAGSTQHRVHYLIGAIGREPRLDFLSPGLRERAEELQRAGRLFFVGDVARGIYRQTAIAVGEGILAAMKIHWSRKETDS